MKKKSENVNKREFFKKLFCTWKYKPKATSYATFKIFHQYLLQKLNFIRIHVKFDPKWFPSPGACQGHFFPHLLWPMVGTMKGTYIFGKIAEFLSFAFSKLSRSVAQFLLNQLWLNEINLSDKLVYIRHAFNYCTTLYAIIYPLHCP